MSDTSSWQVEIDGLMERAQTTALQELVAGLLSETFGLLSPDVLNRLQAITELRRLRKLTREAVMASDLDSFLLHLSPPSSTAV